MSARRRSGFEHRGVRGSNVVAILSAAAALAGACSSSGDEPGNISFTPEDCRGELVEVARFTDTIVVSRVGGVYNNLAIDGDTLFMTYGFAGLSSGLPQSGGIVAVPVSGGATRVIAAAENTSLWVVDDFWVDGGQVHLQTRDAILSLPAAPPTPSTLPILESAPLYAAYAHDAEFGYYAQADGDGLTITKTPIGGGAPTVLFDEPEPKVSLRGMADAGDALLVHVRLPGEPTYAVDTLARVWRIPKDGTPSSDVRPDVDWADTLTAHQWLAWDGENILGPIMVGNAIVQSRVAPAGTRAPEHLKLNGVVATRRGDEVLSLQNLYVRSGQSGVAGRLSSRVLVASSKGAPAGSVLACGLDAGWYPAGIAATDRDIYVSYATDDAVVIARVAQ